MNDTPLEQMVQRTQRAKYDALSNREKQTMLHNQGIY